MMQNKINSDQIDWWNQIAQKLNGYQGNYNVVVEGNSGEEDFIELVKNKFKKFPSVLDVACADGKFTSEIAAFADRIIGVDLSPIMIEKAKSNSNTKNVEFIVADAKKLPFEDNYFDMIISRRGPVSEPYFLEEAIRVAKPGGQIVEITIGDQDAIEFKEIFNRGQGFTESNKSRYEEVKKRLLLNNRVKLKELREYFCDAYYPTVEDVALLLSSTPIIDDFDLNEDYKYIETIQDKYKTENGIRRTYHRLIWVIEKIM
jgi:ubiquinone/menaquinone biosynthesis C-methylase UbiE